MNAKCLFLLCAVAGLWTASLAGEQGQETKAAGTITRGNSGGQQGRIPAVTGQPGRAVGSGQKPASGLGKRMLQPQQPEAAALKPGVYETYPYTCIVVVPPERLDSKGLIPMPAPQGSPDILNRQPDLQFVPRNSK